MSLGLRTVMVDSSVLMLVHDDDAKMPTISQPTHTHHTDECINKQRRRRKHTTQTTSITLSPSSSFFFTPFLLSILLPILLLVVLFLPQPTLAGGPRLLSSEYEIRTLKVGTIQYSPSTHLSNANAATGGEGAGDSHEYELAWRRYQLLAIDLIFDQPLYISSVHAIADAKNGGNKKSSKNAKPSAPHSSSNDTSLPHLDGSIILDCVDEQHFVLSKWPTANGESGKNNMSSDDTFWSSPQPVLLPSYSPSNSLKDQLRDLFDPYSDMDHTGGVPKRRSQTLFGLDSHAMKDVLQVAGRPNVLSLMLVMQYEDGASGEMKTFLDWAKYYSNTQDMNITNPLGDLCRIRYESIHDRQAKLEMQLAHLNLLATEVMEDTKTDDGRVGSDDHPQQLRQRVEAKMEDMYGLTNFKGHEIVLATSALAVRGGLRSAFVPSRTLFQVDAKLEADFVEEEQQQRDKEGCQQHHQIDDDDERLYAHSPLDDERKSSSNSVTDVASGRPLTAAPPSTAPPTSSSSSSLALAHDIFDDPFNNILLDMGAASQFVNLILRPICHGVMKPATKGTNDLLLDDIMTELGNNMFYSVVDEVGPDLSIMLGLTIGPAVSNVLQDSLTYAITKSLTQAIEANVSPYVVERLLKNLPGPLHTIIHAILEKKIPDRLERTMPIIMSRVLSVTLTHSLTRSIPHVVVPTVSHSLGLGHAGSFSRPKAYYEVCMKCYLQSIGAIPPVRMSPPDMNPDGYDTGVGSGGQKAGSECGACPTSTYSMYYGIYHAAYYTDFYSEYYAEYYSQAMQMVDEAMYKEDGNPSGVGGEEEGGGEGGGEGGEGGEGAEGGEGGEAGEGGGGEGDEGGE